MRVFPLPLHTFLRFTEQTCDPLYNGWIWASVFALTKSCFCRRGSRLGGEHRVRCVLVLLVFRSSLRSRCPRCWRGWHLSCWCRRRGWSRLLECWENGLTEHSRFPFPSFHRRYDRSEVGLRCRVLEFFLYWNFFYSPIWILSKASHDNPS